MRRICLAVAVLCCTFVLSACNREPLPPLVARNVAITMPLPGRQMSAGYLSLTNNTDVDVNITAVTSDAFRDVQIHESTLTNGIARMRKIDSLLLPANSTVVLEGGGKHLMLMNPKARPNEAPPTHVSLTFLDGEETLLSVDASVATNVSTENP